MPGIALSTANDRIYTGSVLWCDFRTGKIPARFCNQIVLTSGNAPSYATFGVPVADFGPTKYDRAAREVAFAALGPMKDVKFRTMARCGINVDGYEQTKLVGWYVARTHSLGPLADDIAGQVYDARWRLSKVTTKYRLTWDPSTDVVYWDPTPLRFNDFGYPNCVDHPTLGPLFGPCHRFGYSNSYVKDDIKEPLPGEATARARSWRGQDAIRYLQTCHAANKKCPLPVVDWGRDRLPPEIIWPDGLGNVPGNDRTLKDLSEHGESLLDALCDVLRHMGPYDLGTEPDGGWNTRLCVYDMKPSAAGPQQLFLPDYFGTMTPGQLVRESAVLHDCTVTESIVNYSDDVAILGDPPRIETFCSSLTAPFGNADMDRGIGWLEKAWDNADETAYKDYITKHGDSEEAEAVAKKRYPLVYAAWRIPLGADFWSGTKWDGFLNKNRIRICPNQLTGYNMSASNPRNWQPREQVVEVLIYPAEEEPDRAEPPDPSWVYAVSYDNLTLSADSIILLASAVRDDGDKGRRSYYQRVLEADSSYGANLHARKIRVNLAILADWPIIGRALDDPNNTQSRIDQTDKFTWQVVAEPMDYIEDLRRGDSRPVGNRSGGNVVDPQLVQDFPPRVAPLDELFSDRPGPAATPTATGRLPRHAAIRQQEARMIEVSGTGRVACHAPCWKPGLPVEIVGANTIPNYAVLKTVVFNTAAPVLDDIGEHTVLHFGRPDTGIWDAPSGGGRAATSASNAGYEASGGGDTHKEKPKDGGTYSPPPAPSTPAPYQPESGTAPERRVPMPYAPEETPAEATEEYDYTGKASAGTMLSPAGNPDAANTPRETVRESAPLRPSQTLQGAVSAIPEQVTQAKSEPTPPGWSPEQWRSLPANEKTKYGPKADRPVDPADYKRDQSIAAKAARAAQLAREAKQSQAISGDISASNRARQPRGNEEE